MRTLASTHPEPGVQLVPHDRLVEPHVYAETPLHACAGGLGLHGVHDAARGAAMPGGVRRMAHVNRRLLGVRQRVARQGF